MKSCFLFGHGDAPDNIISDLEKSIEDYYTNLSVRCFYVGNRGNFDRLAAAAVKKVKQHHPDLQLYLLLAYHPGERSVDLTDGFDGSYYPPLEGVPRRYAIVRANQYMVDHADSVICYVSHIGNTKKLLEYARSKKISLSNIADILTTG